MNEQFVSVKDLYEVIEKVHDSLKIIDVNLGNYCANNEDIHELIALNDFLYQAMNFVDAYPEYFNLVHYSVETSMLVKLTRLIILYIKQHNLVKKVNNDN